MLKFHINDITNEAQTKQDIKKFQNSIEEYVKIRDEFAIQYTALQKLKDEISQAKDNDKIVLMLSYDMVLFNLSTMWCKIKLQKNDSIFKARYPEMAKFIENIFYFEEM